MRVFKKLLVFGVVFFGLITFCSAYTITRDNYIELTSSNNRTASVSAGYCVYLNFSSRSFNVVDGNNTLTLTNPMNTFYCFENGGTITTTSTSTTTINIYDFDDYVSSISSCDYSDYELKTDITESYCTNKFNTLIPISAVDSNYCSINGLCSYDCPEGSGDVQWSALYINNIQHQSAPIIGINIPEEISWDYTGDESSFYLDVNGYNVDTNYISGIINTQSSIPDQSDFNSLISNVLPLFIPGLVIILFIYFVFRFVKKIF